MTLQAAEKALEEGKSVVVDNTNPSADARADYIALAKKYKVPCRCFVMDTPIELCHHLNYVRVQQTNGEIRRIPGKHNFDMHLIDAVLRPIVVSFNRCGLQHVQKELFRTQN